MNCMAKTIKRKALIVFIRNPELGKVKTRLAKKLGDEKALQIYIALFQHTRQEVLEVEAGRLLFYSEKVALNDDWPAEHFEKYLQHDGGLGERMHYAFERALQTHDQAIIVGSDIAGLKAAIINRAFEVLQHHDYVIGPAMDGGYYLLGMKKPSPELFLDMEWSTPEVFQQTISRIEQHGGSWQAVDTLSDIDYAEDWEKYGWEI
jgi:rSAM/selenodomain-associated transferase 1